MFSSLNLFLIFMFCGTAVFILNALIFMRGPLLASVMMNLLSVIILLFGGVTDAYNLCPAILSCSFVMAGAAVYPASIAYLVHNHVLPKQRISSLLVAAASAVIFILSFILQEYRYLLLGAVFIPGIIYIAVNIVIPSGGFLKSAITVVSAAGMTAAAAAAFSGSFELVAAACSASSFIVYILLTINFRINVNSALKQVGLLSEMNLKLAHTISRYRQSNDQCRKIIADRELDLFQLARHASLAELTAGIAHELSQPLTGIKGIAQNMIDDINYDEFEALQAVSELTKISFLVDKSSSLIDHIRNFSRKKIFSMAPLDLNDVIINAIELIRLQVKKNDIEIVFILDDNISRIRGDSISLEQLIVNLILNAKDAIVEKYSAGTERNGVITVTTAEQGRSVVLMIQDNGIGMSEDVIQKMWSPFFTTKKKDHGTGIGLSLSRKIIRDHGAAVEVKSSRGTGTAFDIFFPADMKHPF